MALIGDIIEHPVLIEYLAGASNYTWLHFQNGRRQLISKPLRYFEERLPDFVRVHKTALINPNYVRHWQAPPRRRMAGSVQMASNVVLPVGRRRWTDVAQILNSLASAPTDAPAPVHYRSVICLTNDQTKALLLQQTIEQQCPDCQAYCLSNGDSLPDLVRVLPNHERPALILLDARTSLVGRLATLRMLKSDPATASIPTLLLVSPDAPDVVEKGYAEQANSVVPVSAHNGEFVQAISRLIHYWLVITRLPERQ